MRCNVSLLTVCKALRMSCLSSDEHAGKGGRNTGSLIYPQMKMSQGIKLGDLGW